MISHFGRAARRASLPFSVILFPLMFSDVRDFSSFRSFTPASDTLV